MKRKTSDAEPKKERKTTLFGRKPTVPNEERQRAKTLFRRKTTVLNDGRPRSKTDIAQKPIKPSEDRQRARTTIGRKATVSTTEKQRIQSLLGRRTQVMLCAKALVDAGKVEIDKFGFGELVENLKGLGWEEEDLKFITKEVGKLKRESWEKAVEELREKGWPEEDLKLMEKQEGEPYVRAKDRIEEKLNERKLARIKEVLIEKGWHEDDLGFVCKRESETHYSTAFNRIMNEDLKYSKLDLNDIHREVYGEYDDVLNDELFNKEYYEDAFKALCKQYISSTIISDSEYDSTYYSTSPTLKSFLSSYTGGEDNADSEYSSDEDTMNEVQIRETVQALLESEKGNGLLMYARAYLEHNQFCDLLSVVMNSKSLVSVNTVFEGIQRFKQLKESENGKDDAVKPTRLFLSTVKNKPAEFLNALKSDLANQNFDGGIQAKGNEILFLSKIGASPRENLHLVSQSMGLKGSFGKEMIKGLLTGYVKKGKLNDFEEAFNEKGLKRIAAVIKTIRGDRLVNPFTYVHVAVESAFAAAMIGIDTATGTQMGTPKPNPSHLVAIGAKTLLNVIRVPIIVPLRVLGDPIGVGESLVRTVKKVAKDSATRFRNWREKRSKSTVDKVQQESFEHLKKLDEFFGLRDKLNTNLDTSVYESLNDFLNENKVKLIEAGLINTTEFAHEVDELLKEPNLTEERKAMLKHLKNKVIMPDTDYKSYNRQEIAILFKHMQSQISSVKNEITNGKEGLPGLIEKINEAKRSKPMKSAIKAIVKNSRIPWLDLSKVRTAVTKLVTPKSPRSSRSSSISMVDTGSSASDDISSGLHSTGRILNGLGQTEIDVGQKQSVEESQDVTVSSDQAGARHEDVVDKEAETTITEVVGRERRDSVGSNFEWDDEDSAEESEDSAKESEDDEYNVSPSP